MLSGKPATCRSRSGGHSRQLRPRSGRLHAGLTARSLSGASLERPALQALLAEVRGRRVDTVVVYKVDRRLVVLHDLAVNLLKMEQVGGHCKD